MGFFICFRSHESSIAEETAIHTASAADYTNGSFEGSGTIATETGANSATALLMVSPQPLPGLSAQPQSHRYPPHTDGKRYAEVKMEAQKQQLHQEESQRMSLMKAILLMLQVSGLLVSRDHN